MVCILPSTDQLDAAMVRADAAWAARNPGIAPPPPIAFADWVDEFDFIAEHFSTLPGPLIDAGVLGAADARLIADALDFAMQTRGHALRARRRGF